MCETIKCTRTFAILVHLSSLPDYHSTQLCARQRDLPWRFPVTCKGEVSHRTTRKSVCIVDRERKTAQGVLFPSTKLYTQVDWLYILMTPIISVQVKVNQQNNWVIFWISYSRIGRRKRTERWWSAWKEKISANG